MADEQAATNDDDHFVKPKIPFRKPLVDLSDKLDQKPIVSNQPQAPEQEPIQKKIPNPLTHLKPPSRIFYLDEIKDGTVCKRHYLNNSVIVLGRATDGCDITFEHCSISRFHAALYWKEKTSSKEQDKHGFFYLTDLSSSHGTFHNKTQVEQGKFLLLQPNKSFIKLGASSRLLLFNCVDEEDSGEEEEQQTTESNPYVSYFRDLKEKSKQVTKERFEQEDDCCTWGMITAGDLRKSTVVQVESGLQTVLSILNQNIIIERTENENAYAQNPQKSIQHWFESEGYDYEYTVANENNKFKCTITFPIDDQHVPISGEDELRKKDAINSACLRACKVLDKAGILFSWQKSNRAEKRRQESDDEDDLLDETGEKESKRARLEAMKHKKADNLETLTKHLDELKTEIDKLSTELANLDKQMSASKSGHKDTIDELDQYMQSVSASGNYSMNDLKIKKSKAKMKMGQLIKEKERTERLIKLAQPSPNTFLAKHPSASASKVSELIEKAKAKLVKQKEEESTVVIVDEERPDTGKVIEVNLNEKLAEQQSTLKTSLSFSKPAGKAILPKVDLGEDVEDEKKSEKKPLILIDSEEEEDSDGPEEAPGVDPKARTVEAGKGGEASQSERQHEVRCEPKSQTKSQPKRQPEGRPKEQPARIACRRDEEEEIDDADKYVEWIPPEERETIDSRSHLNDKYGY